MSCCSNTSAPVAPGVQTTAGCSSPGTPTPRRVSIPPVTPVIMSSLPKARQAELGRLLVANCEELNVLDSGLSGPVVFDSMTGTVSVSPTEAANLVADNFSTCDTSLSGFPVYARTPSCRDVGDAPDRDLIIARPQQSSVGTLYGHTAVCPTSFGLLPEMLPVEIVPAVLPVETPENLFTLGFIDVAATNCAPASRKFYAVPPADVSGVDIDDMETVDFPASPDDDTTGLAMWQLNESGTKWVLVKVTNDSLIDKLSSKFFEVSPRYSAMLTIKAPETPVFGIGSPHVRESKSVNLANVPGYKDTFTTVSLYTELTSVADTGGFELVMTINGRQQNKVSTRYEPSSDSCSNSVVIPIPANKTLDIVITETTFYNGTRAAATWQVGIDGFQ